jgi:hypothetical protein
LIVNFTHYTPNLSPISSSLYRSYE